ncbi:S-adenosyl-L-methionine-dependent methyltransferase [Atractiella rhizophila]|nr:S-adenosyl-L-methionine-dependent methyltransferase [Atractiella rhizophila]
MADTFASKAYSTSDYAEYRPKPPQALYDHIFEFHNRSGGQYNVAIDIGCGPGQAAIDLSGSFREVIGVDPSETMLETARSTGPPANLSFRQGHADAVPFIKDASVDLVAASVAAHWFPPRWYDEMARILKPGGTLAIWCYSGYIIDRKRWPSAPTADDLKASMHELRDHDAPGNDVINKLYDNLPLPDPDSAWTSVDRRAFDRQGKMYLEDGSFFMPALFTLKTLRKNIFTIGPCHRWKVANPSLVGTDGDPIERVVRRVQEVMSIKDEDEEFVLGREVALLLFRRKGAKQL